MDQDLGGGNVGGNGNVVYIAQAQQIQLVRLMGLRIDGVAEEQQQVDLIAGNARCNLLVAAMGTGQEALNGQACGLADHLSRSARGHQRMLAQHAAVCDAELHHQFFFGIMGNQRNGHSNSSSSRLFLISGAQRTTRGTSSPCRRAARASTAR